MNEDEVDLTQFPPPKRTQPASLYLISPQEVGGVFPDRLKAALEGGPVAAFQMRVKDKNEHELARLAEPLQLICAGQETWCRWRASRAERRRSARGQGAARSGCADWPDMSR